ncbi:MAG: hypothetical protein HYV07_23235 [Deltaproteobacteria bacterium]|nr:hypothetical protein [Deltaproteobacteria bacterium]
MPGPSEYGPEPRTKPGPTPPPNPAPGQGQMWDVWFDRKEGTRTVQRSPIVLDLNGNGKADITGSNVLGNGRIEGQSVRGFDLDPSARQWSTKSVRRRPGRGAPKLPEGTTMKVFDASGNLVSSRAVTSRDRRNDFGLASGQRAEFWDKDGKLVSELKKDPETGRRMYFFGNRNENEWTKPWENGQKGDGILAWDVDGDGKITSGKELFGEVDTDGTRKFANGYEKLSKYFDRNGDGQVSGDEMAGLKVWEDRNGDGVTQEGELIDAREAGVSSLNTSFDRATMGSSYSKV